jgi:polysaccharide lyase-like protein/uncharacterized protein DUF4124
MLKVFLVAITLLLVPVAGNADVYLWRDAQGASRFSNTPPREGARDVRKFRTSLKFFATFGTSPFRTATGDGTSDDGVWWVEQKAGTNRATIVNIGSDGRTGLRLHTEPGDNNVSSSGILERNDVALPQKTTDCYEGREQWWEHSILFPDDYVAPPASARYSFSWNVVFDFHNSAPGPWQANFHTEVATLSPDPNNPLLNPDPPILRFRGYGGKKSGDGAFTAPIGPVVKNEWYDFVYHVKWSSGTDGYFDAWVNGVQKLSHKGPTLYVGQGCYLKLANYHVPFRQASSVIHDRVVRYEVERP